MNDAAKGRRALLVAKHLLSIIFTCLHMVGGRG